ncbi:uncharacterized protein BDW47DRAFT_72227 [Aspergillus candidus]|uniref:Uncharacterized protein n=1 Tax=Aspergillus candidus TaxID=41067 RepID=A0A2I2F229_ASPCN|nr:hypothetical protein BDW47DRAFT_72227 [Aspergillus candidus]PLB34693.1 hypothetical protein BDW47DRAFT_72227 [Aspergillus candidus]
MSTSLSFLMALSSAKLFYIILFYVVLFSPSFFSFPCCTGKRLHLNVHFLTYLYKQ